MADKKDKKHDSKEEKPAVGTHPLTHSQQSYTLPDVPQETKDDENTETDEE